MRIFILLLTASLSVVTILGGLSAVNILSDPNNIQVPAQGYSITSNVIGPNDTWYVNVPIGINNVGYFDLNNLELDFSLEMEFNSTGDDSIHNTTIYNDVQNFGNLQRGSSGVFEFNATSFTVPSFHFLEPYEFRANITVSAYYSLDLILFEIHIIDLDIS
ncbi:MAG: hypothetical protein KGD63_08805 [Candidatus Lokiarchaeota archaeon]|nr:hypothetical protein [Candidatus Lokiarchaeota archaeon]